jgi:hypothetical protein
MFLITEMNAEVKIKGFFLRDSMPHATTPICKDTFTSIACLTRWLMNSFYTNGRLHQIPQLSAGNTQMNGKDEYPTMLKQYSVPSLDELLPTLTSMRI